MDSTVSITQLQKQAPQVLKRAAKNGSLAICRRGRTVAFVVSRERMEAILETLQIMADKKLMKSVRDFEAGKMKPKPLNLDEISPLGPSLSRSLCRKPNTSEIQSTK